MNMSVFFQSVTASTKENEDRITSSLLARALTWEGGDLHSRPCFRVRIQSWVSPIPNKFPNPYAKGYKEGNEWMHIDVHVMAWNGLFQIADKCKTFSEPNQIFSDFLICWLNINNNKKINYSVSFTLAENMGALHEKGSEWRWVKVANVVWEWKCCTYEGEKAEMWKKSNDIVNFYLSKWNINLSVQYFIAYPYKNTRVFCCNCSNPPKHQYCKQ